MEKASSTCNLNPSQLGLFWQFIIYPEIGGGIGQMTGGPQKQIVHPWIIKMEIYISTEIEYKEWFLKVIIKFTC